MRSVKATNRKSDVVEESLAAERSSGFPTIMGHPEFF
jgi:hypothetical protein